MRVARGRIARVAGLLLGSHSEATRKSIASESSSVPHGDINSGVRGRDRTLRRSDNQTSMPAMKTISATTAARSFSDVLNRVKFRGEEFMIVRGGEEVARLSPVTSVPIRFGELLELLRDGRRWDLGFARDLEFIQASQPKLDTDPWSVE